MPDIHFFGYDAEVTSRHIKSLLADADYADLIAYHRSSHSAPLLASRQVDPSVYVLASQKWQDQWKQDFIRRVRPFYPIVLVTIEYFPADAPDGVAPL